MSNRDDDDLAAEAIAAALGVFIAVIAAILAVIVILHMRISVYPEVRETLKRVGLVAVGIGVGGFVLGAAAGDEGEAGFVFIGIGVFVYLVTTVVLAIEVMRQEKEAREGADQLSTYLTRLHLPTAAEPPRGSGGGREPQKKPQRRVIHVGARQ